MNGNNVAYFSSLRATAKQKKVDYLDRRTNTEVEERLNLTSRITGRGKEVNVRVVEIIKVLFTGGLERVRLDMTLDDFYSSAIQITSIDSSLESN